MIHYYLMIIAGKVVDDSTTFYKVGVGSSKRDKLALCKLSEFAAANGHYMHIMDNETTEFLGKIADSLGKQVYELPTSVVRVQIMCGIALQSNTAHVLPPPSPSSHYLLTQIDPNYYFHHAPGVIQSAESETRNKPKVVKNTQKGMIPSLITI